MRKIYLVFGLAALLAAACTGKQYVEDDVVYVTLEGEECPFAEKAEYGVYLPPSHKKLNAVLVLQHGCGMEQFGITRPYDLQYRAFAKKWNLAVVEPSLHGNCIKWGNPEWGSPEGLFTALARAGLESGHPELSELPLLLFGHSGGGYWVLAMLREYPERILAAVCYSAAWAPQWYYDEAAVDVPLLMRHAGLNDGRGSSMCPETAEWTFNQLTKRGAPVSIVCNHGQNHNLSYLRHMAIPFYEAALRERLPRGLSSKLRKLDPSKTYVVDTASFEVYREKDYEGSTVGMSRFPDMESALKFQEFARTNDIVDVTPPAKPYELSATRLPGGEIELKWKADADVESGIRCFEILLGDTIIGRVPETGNYQNFDINGDNTYPVNPPEMSFVDSNATAGILNYGVRTVNQSGYASEIKTLNIKK